MDGTATYLYCIVHATAVPSSERAPSGLPGASRPAVAAIARSLWLVTATVPLQSYGSGPLEESLRDVRWVTDLAVAHEAVVEHFAKQRGKTVIPMKLFTMFSSESRAVDEMRQRRRILEGVVKRIAGCEEWGVRIRRRVDANAGTPQSPQNQPTGTAFLAAKKAARDAAQQSARAASETAEHAFDTLSALAREARRRDDLPEGASIPPLLDAAFLVPASNRRQFKAAVNRLARAGAAGTEVTLTGPWPSYNFVQAAATS